MPLHLLGKKSWNVYNADNIARVRRDEAAAEAAEQAEEQRMQEIDAQRRLAILRGEEPPPLPESEKRADDEKRVERRPREDFAGSGRRQRKRHGEDDTDFELRLARERQGDSDLVAERQKTSSAPIVDHAGHIDLFGDEKQRMHSEKNEEVERQKRKKEREYEDQYTMRFSNAAGRQAPEKPWYSSSSTEITTATVAAPSKDVWGNDDPRRRDRQAQRAAANDPLAMMRSGAAKVRELKKERKKLREEREGELKELKREERRGERHGRREKSRSRDRHRRRERSRSRERRHRSRSGERRDRHERRRDREEDPRERRDRRRDGEESHRSRVQSRSRSPRRD